MLIKISSVATDATIASLNNFYIALEDSLNEYLSDESFGSINQFRLVIVAVHENLLENNEYCKKNNSSGSFINPFTKKLVNYFSIAIPYSPAKVVSLNESDLRTDLCNEIVHCLEHVTVKIPKGFEFARFAEKIKNFLAVYKNGNF